MNLFTLFGAAALDRNFGNLLFSDPAAAIRTLGLFLTQSELNFVLKTVTGDDAGEVHEHFLKVAGGVCPHPPCPIITLATLDEDSDDDRKEKS